MKDAWRTDEVEGLLARFVAGPELARRLKDSGAPLNTDDRNALEFGFARTLGVEGLLDVAAVREAAAEAGASLPTGRRRLRRRPRARRAAQPVLGRGRGPAPAEHAHRGHPAPGRRPHPLDPALASRGPRGVARAGRGARRARTSSRWWPRSWPTPVRKRPFATSRPCAPTSPSRPSPAWAACACARAGTTTPWTPSRRPSPAIARDPWPAPLSMQGALDAALELVAQKPELTPRVLQALRERVRPADAERRAHRGGVPRGLERRARTGLRRPPGAPRARSPVHRRLARLSACAATPAPTTPASWRRWPT